MRRERLRIGIATVGCATVAIAVGHVTATVPVGVVTATERGVAVQSAMERRGPASR